MENYERHLSIVRLASSWRSLTQSNIRNISLTSQPSISRCYLITKNGASDHMKSLRRSGQISNVVISKAPCQIGGENSHATDPGKPKGKPLARGVESWFHSIFRSRQFEPCDRSWETKGQPLARGGESWFHSIFRLRQFEPCDGSWETRGQPLARDGESWFDTD
jgi:hypothetical protein